MPTALLISFAFQNSVELCLLIICYAQRQTWAVAYNGTVSKTLESFPYLQVTVFMALLVLDNRRLQHNRLDCLPCIRVPYRDVSGNWVHDDVSDDEEYEPLNPGSNPDNSTSGVLNGIARRLGALNIPGFRGANRGQRRSTQGPGEMYYAPQQQLLRTSAGAAAVGDAGSGEIRVHQQHRQQQGLVRGRRGSEHVPEVLPGVTHKGPGLLHGDKISLQSLLQVSLPIYFPVASDASNSSWQSALAASHHDMSPDTILCMFATWSPATQALDPLNTLNRLLYSGSLGTAGREQGAGAFKGNRRPCTGCFESRKWLNCAR